MSQFRFYATGVTALFQGAVNYPTDTVQCALMNNTYVPNQDTDTWSAVASKELSGGSYARQTLASKSLYYDPNTNILRLRCAPITFPAFTGTWRVALFVVNKSGSPLLGYIDYGADQAVGNAAVTIDVSPTAGVGSLGLY